MFVKHLQPQVACIFTHDQAQLIAELLNLEIMIKKRQLVGWSEPCSHTKELNTQLLDLEITLANLTEAI